MKASESLQVIEPIVAAAAALRDRGEEVERARRLPRDVVDLLLGSGVFRLCVPRALGGLEADVPTLLAAVEEIANADGSAGWCAMIGATSGLVAGYLEDATAREIYADPAAITGGVFAPRGTARRDGHVYVASGRWPFASGCEHCTWLMGGCVISPATAGTAPEMRMLLFAARDVSIHDTWDVAGLRGTGSHDMEVRDLLVPVERSAGLTTDAPRARGELYRFPVFGLLALGISAVSIGVASRAIEELERLALDKTPMGSRRRLADRGAVQSEVARARAEVGSARAYIADVVGAAHEEVHDGELTVETRALLRVAASHATRCAASAVDRMYEAGGGTSVYARSPLQRCFRDVHVATQHAMVAAPTFELAGRVLLGLDTDTSQL